MRPALLALSALMIAVPAAASLPVGAQAPDFTTVGAIAGRQFKLHLAEQLKQGPVVLYFFPKAFTSGCTAEAHAFSDAAAEFRKAGAHIIGMSADDLPTLKKFSVQECRNAFPVATATPDVIRNYDVSMPVAGKLIALTNRTSYVIARNGTISMVHSDLSWKDHVGLTLAAVKALR